MPELSMPPKKSILLPDHTAVWAARGEGALLGGKGRGVQLQVGQLPVRACPLVPTASRPCFASPLHAASSSSAMTAIDLRGSTETRSIFPSTGSIRQAHRGIDRHPAQSPQAASGA